MNMADHLNEPDAKAALDAVEASAAALTAALDRASALGIPIEIDVRGSDETGRREVVARLVRAETGRRPEDLNSSNDD